MEGRGVPMTWKDPLRAPPPRFHFSSTPSTFFVLPALPTPITSWGREGRGRLSFLLAQRAAPPPGHPGGDGRAAPGVRPLGLPGEGQAGRAEGRAAGDGGREAARPALPLTTGRPGPASSGPATGSPAWNMTFWTLWVETTAWTVERGTPPSQGHLGPPLSPGGL